MARRQTVSSMLVQGGKGDNEAALYQGSSNPLLYVSCFQVSLTIQTKRELPADGDGC